MILAKIENFSVKGHDPYTPLMGNSMETGEELMGVTSWIPARVPESIYRTLLRAGLIPDPFVDRNSLSCEWVANRWLSYRACFPFSKKSGRRYRLRIDHLDYTGHLWLNHQPIGVSSNVSVPFYADITDLLKDENVLDILLEHAPEEHGQIGYTSKTHTQKPRFNYKWDWCMRLVSLGISSPVYIEEFGVARIESLRTEQDFQEEDAILSASVFLQGFEESELQLTASLTFGDATAAKQQLTVPVKAGEQMKNVSLRVPGVRLWYPNGHGEQPLYRLRIRLCQADGSVSDEKLCTIGFHQIQHLPCTDAPEGALPYKVQINGRDIYLKGVNYLPPEMSLADITEERLEQVLQNVAAANCNLIRIWGGAYIGSDELYEICDRLGILVWQEFLQSSSGIDNIPSKDPYFLSQLADTARAAVMRIRTHPSLLLYSGGNELTDAWGVPSDFEDENVRMLQKIVQENDSRFMLPTSASGPNEFLDLSTPGRNHDVHGPWKYSGTTEHYTLFNQSDSLLHSEFGVDGMSNYSLLKRMLSPEHLRVTNMRDNLVWRHRGELWDTYDRTIEIFGGFPPEDLAGFIRCSQYIQAEGLRYALEANRRRAFRNCGSIIWQYNEPCPNVSGTNLEDYYGDKKLAWYFVRDAFRPVTPSLRYDKLLWKPGETARLQPVVLNDSLAFEGTLKVTAESSGGNLLFVGDYPVSVPERQNLPVESFSIDIPQASAVTISLRLEGGGQTILSEYLLLTEDESGHADRAAVFAVCQKYLSKSGAESD